ncbi:MAG: glycosyltransferase family 4 protein, partial [Chloroflexota bacterium]|nr:glycosyltransferase family 4 protein [Chloroflexota bacterium]
MSKPRVLYVPMLFQAERWNGIMEHLRLLIDGLGGEITPLLVTRPDDGEQTALLAAATGVETCPLRAGRSAGELRRLCRERRIDIVHIQTPVAGGMPRLAVGARVSGARVVVTFQQTQLDPLRGPRRLLTSITQRHVVDRCIAVSESVADSLVTLSGFDRFRIDIVHNAVAPYEEASGVQGKAIELDDSAVWAGYFGRLAEEKDVACLLRALAIASRQERRLKVLIVGDGYERDRLLALTAQLGL